MLEFDETEAGESQQEMFFFAVVSFITTQFVILLDLKRKKLDTAEGGTTLLGRFLLQPSVAPPALWRSPRP